MDGGCNVVTLEKCTLSGSTMSNGALLTALNGGKAELHGCTFSQAAADRQAPHQRLMVCAKGDNSTIQASDCVIKGGLLASTGATVNLHGCKISQFE